MTVRTQKTSFFQNRFKSCWIITDEGKIGTENQCIGLAGALGLQYTLKRVSPKPLWSLFPPKLWINPLACLNQEIAPPWPSLIIGAGRASSAPVAYIRNASQGRTKVIQLLNPYLDPKNFDLVIVPEHDQFYGSNVIQTQGALNKLTDESLAQGKKQFAPLLKSLPRPLVAVLIGGSNKNYKLTPEILKKLVLNLKNLIDTQGVGVAITVSRRTGIENTILLRKAMKDLPVIIWDGHGPNPYFGFLAHAEYILVTEESVSMISEACYTGKPVYVIPLEGISSKFERFHHSLREKGYTRLFNGSLEKWEYSPLKETQRVAQEVVQVINLDQKK